MEALDETEEYENAQFDGELTCCPPCTTLYHVYVDSKESTSKRPPSPMRMTPGDSFGPNRRSSTSTSGHATNISLDKLTGDSLLSFSYSAASGGSGFNLDSQLGESLNSDLCA